MYAIDQVFEKNPYVSTLYRIVALQPNERLEACIYGFQERFENVFHPVDHHVTIADEAQFSNYNDEWLQYLVEFSVLLLSAFNHTI